MYYIYSKKPLYLKRWFFLASPLLAFNALLIAMAGFFLISANQKILAFPIETIWFMLIGFSIVTNLKDIKDIEGDRAAGIKTLPVIFGQEKAKKIITIAAIIFILIFAVYKQNSYLIFSSVIISALFYLITSRKIFKETYIFGLFFLYLMVIMLA
jgi:4-hydroxybenzoate polyprenyltransferase